MNILMVDGLCKQYPTFRLQDVSFSMQPGTIMGFIGRNGAGKTTTLKSILHLVHPDSGKIEIFGMDMDTHEREIREKIGFVSGGIFCYPRKWLQTLSAVTRRFYPGWDDARYRQLLSRFSLDEHKRVCELSEGMKVKYQLAVAMSHGAQLLILDEPTSGLDPVSRDELLELFMTLAERDGVSILFSTHITSDLDACADAVTYIRGGSIVESCDKAAFTDKWLLVSGEARQMAQPLREALVGLSCHKGRFEGLLHAESRALAAGAACAPASLEAVMVHLEREEPA